MSFKILIDFIVVSVYRYYVFGIGGKNDKEMYSSCAYIKKIKKKFIGSTDIS